MAILLLAGALLDAPSILATLWPASACYILHLIEGNAVTPVFVGNRLTISPFLVFLVFIAFIFWLWLWGPVGAVLSTPIVIVAMVAQEEFARYRRDQAKADAGEAGEVQAA